MTEIRCVACGRSLPGAGGTSFCPFCGTEVLPETIPATLKADRVDVDPDVGAGPDTDTDATLPAESLDHQGTDRPHPKVISGAASAADGADSLLGTRVADRFLVKSRLGAGGMGTVYLAEQTAVNRPVVLKFLHPHLFSQPDLNERFHREALAASKLTCPNTIVLFDFGQSEAGLQYMAMEYLEGRQLTEMIKSEGSMPPLRAIAIILQVLSSLEEAHDKGIVHRDLKPDNIMLVHRAGTNDFVKVLDFGIAKLMDQAENPQSPATSEQDRPSSGSALEFKTQLGAICGSPGYMAPEQVLGKEVDHRADLYAVGVILYQMLSGSKPFKGNSVMELLQEAVDGEVKPLSSSRPDLALPGPLDRLILKCLHKDPERRPGSAAALAVQIRGLVPEISRQQQEQERALLELVGIQRRWPRLLRWAIPAAVILALVGVVLALLLRPGAEGVALGPGQRIFVLASAAKVPGWVATLTGVAGPGETRSRSDSSGVTSVSSAPHRAQALRRAEAEVLARLADVPPRFDPVREKEQYNLDLEQVIQRADGLETKGKALLSIQTYWARFSTGLPAGGRGTTYDAFAHMGSMTPALQLSLRSLFSELRYDRYTFLADEAVRTKRCSRANELADRVNEAIDHLPKKDEQKKRLRFILRFKLRPCLTVQDGPADSGTE